MMMEYLYLRCTFRAVLRHEKIGATMLPEENLYQHRVKLENELGFSRFLVKIIAR